MPRKPTSDWLPYDTSHYTVEACKATAKELRRKGRTVRLGSYLKEGGRRYCKIYVKRQ